MDDEESCLLILVGTAKRLLLLVPGRTAFKKLATVPDMVDFLVGISLLLWVSKRERERMQFVWNLRNEDMYMDSYVTHALSLRGPRVVSVLISTPLSILRHPSSELTHHESIYVEHARMDYGI